MTDTLVDDGFLRCPDANHIGAFRQCPTVPVEAARTSVTHAQTFTAAVL